MLEKLNEELEDFLSKHPVLTLSRIPFLTISLLLYSWMKNSFTSFLVFIAFLFFFSETILKFLNTVFKLISQIVQWRKRNKEDISDFSKFLSFELLAFIFIMFTSIVISVYCLELLNWDVDILNSNSASLSISCFCIVLVALVFVFFLTLVTQHIYFLTHFNMLGFKMIEYTLVFFEGIIAVFILGLNSIAHEYIEIHKDLFIPYLEGIEYEEIAITVKAIYALLLYYLISATSAFHIATKITYANKIHPENKDINFQ